MFQVQPNVHREMRRVTAINNGTVIDHIPAGSALSVLRMLGISDDRASPISLVMNVPSSKHGRKDIIKVEDRELTQDELDRLALIAPRQVLQLFAHMQWLRNVKSRLERNWSMWQMYIF